MNFIVLTTSVRSLCFNAFLVVVLCCVSANVAFSLSPPRIWPSRNTSKTDALDDDETPLGVTASQTVTTRGVMVSEIIGALDIAPTLHFVGPGMNSNGEEWIKVMDEYTVPNCTALVEPGRKFLLLLDNAPSQA